MRVGDWEKDLERDRKYTKKRWQKNEERGRETDSPALSEDEPGSPRAIKGGSTMHSERIPHLCRVPLAHLMM